MPTIVRNLTISTGAVTGFEGTAHQLLTGKPTVGQILRGDQYQPPPGIRVTDYDREYRCDPRTVELDPVHWRRWESGDTEKEPHWNLYPNLDFLGAFVRVDGTFPGLIFWGGGGCPASAGVYFCQKLMADGTILTP